MALSELADKIQTLVKFFVHFVDVFIAVKLVSCNSSQVFILIYNINALTIYVNWFGDWFFNTVVYYRFLCFLCI